MAKKLITKIILILVIVTGFFIGAVLVRADHISPFDLVNAENISSVDINAYKKIDITEAWELINSTSHQLGQVRIAIFDTGVEIAHQEFDQVSIVGDIAVDQKQKSDGHGTQVAGIISANNLSFQDSYISPQMNGILSGIENLDYVLFSRVSGTFTEFETSVDGFRHFLTIDQLARSDVNIINGSFGAPLCSEMSSFRKFVRNRIGQSCYGDFESFNSDKEIYTDLVNQYQDITFVFSAGNDNIDAQFNLPGGGVVADNVINVGSTDLNDERATFSATLFSHSNFGPTVNIATPGIGVYAPKPGNDYDINFSGTSASAPFVTSTAGLLKAINPNLTPAEIKQILIETGDPINTDKPIGPRLNAHSAVCHQKALACQEEIIASPWSQFQHDERHTGQSPFQGPQTNNIQWTFIPSGTNTFVNTPVVGPNGIIYFGAGTQSIGKLIALNPDGTLKWESSALPNATPTNPAVITDGMAFIVFGSEDFGTNLVALDTDDGSILWTHPVANRVDFVTATSDNLMYFTNENGFLFSLTVSETGATENWSIDLGGIRLVDSAPAIDSTGTIYVIERTISKVTAVNPSGTVKWTRTLPQNTSASALVLDGDTIVVATSNRLNGLNPIDGTDVFSVFYPGTNPSVPIFLPDSRIAVVTENNNTLHRINTITEVVASTSIVNFLPTRPNPIVDSQGTIYLKTDPNTVTATSNTDTILFNKSFSRLVGNFALGNNNTLYIPVLDTGGLQIVAIGPW